MESFQDLEAEYESFSANRRAFSALLFVTSLFMIYVVNKTILLVHMFPYDEVLGLGQMIANVFVLWIGNRCRLIKIPALHKRVARHLLPLPLTFLGRMVATLSTKRLEFPVILSSQLNVTMTLIMEKYVLGINAPFFIKSSILIMVKGALISTLGQHFTCNEYILILSRSSFLAVNLVYLKNIIDLKKIGLCGLLYYDSIIRIVLGLFVICYTKDLAKTGGLEHLKDVFFWCHFYMFCVLGIVHSFGVMLCVQYNGALTTAVIEASTRIGLCYLEDLITRSCVIVWTFFLALNMSILGSLLYTFATCRRKTNTIYTRTDDFKI